MINHNLHLLAIDTESFLDTYPDPTEETGTDLLGTDWGPEFYQR